MTVPFEMTSAASKSKHAQRDGLKTVGVAGSPFGEVIFTGAATVDGGSVEAAVTVRVLHDPSDPTPPIPADADGYPGHPFDLSKSYTITFTENP